MVSPFLVLVADRNRHVRNLLERELRAEGYEVAAARNGREVVELLERGRVDLAILADDLPDSGGLEVLRAMRRRLIDTPVAVLTYSPDETIDGLGEGRAVCVKKSEDMDALKAVVRQALQRFHPDRGPDRNPNRGGQRPAASPQGQARREEAKGDREARRTKEVGGM